MSESLLTKTPWPREERLDIWTTEQDANEFRKLHIDTKMTMGQLLHTMMKEYMEKRSAYKETMSFA